MRGRSMQGQLWYMVWVVHVSLGKARNFDDTAPTAHLYRLLYRTMF
jgi:hypothetical protein